VTSQNKTKTKQKTERGKKNDPKDCKKYEGDGNEDGKRTGELEAKPALPLFYLATPSSSIQRRTQPSACKELLRLARRGS
jgi:hypothetical protein